MGNQSEAQEFTSLLQPSMEESDKQEQVTALAEDVDGQGFNKTITSGTVVLPFVNNGAATFMISGTPALGHTLIAQKLSDDPDGAGTGFSYTWQSSSNGSNWSIVGSGPNYVVRPEDRGMQLRLVVSYTDAQGFLESIGVDSLSIIDVALPSLVKDIFPGSTGSFPTDLTAVGNTVYFSAYSERYGNELWKSDGTAAGTVLVKDIRPGASHSSPSSLTAVGNTLYFIASDGTTGPELWKSDGTAAGTVLVKDIYPGLNGSSDGSEFSLLTAVGGEIYFTARFGAPNRLGLWKSDGSSSGTVLVKEIFPRSLTAVGNTLFFVASDGINGKQLWKSDGSLAGTIPIGAMSPAYSQNGPGFLTRVGNLLYFTIDTPGSAELWKSDGTTSGTVLVKNSSDWMFAPGLLTSVNDTLFFVAHDAVHGQELWKSDGTNAGTTLVKDINPGSYESPYIPFVTVPWNSYPKYLTALAGTLYFRAGDKIDGDELWKSDGTDAGTVLVKDINPGKSYIMPLSSSPGELTAVNNDLYFIAEDGLRGRELWKSNGTTAGTFLVKDIRDGSTATFPYGSNYLTATPNILFFVVNDDMNGSELWSLSLSQPLTLNNGPASFSISGTSVSGNTISAVLLSADPDGNGAFSYVWQTSADGTTWSSVGSNSPSYLVASADEGKQLRLVVSYTDGQGFSEAVTTPAGTVSTVLPPLMEKRAVGMEKTKIIELPTPELATDVSLRQGEDDRPLRAIGVDASSIDLGGRQSDQHNNVTIKAAVVASTADAQAIGLDDSEMLLRPGDDTLVIEASATGNGPGVSIAIRNSFLSGNRGDDTITLRGDLWGDRAIVFGGDGNDRITGHGIGRNSFIQAGSGDDWVSLGRLETTPGALPLVGRDGRSLPVSTYRGGDGFDVLQLRETTQAAFEAEATWFTTAAESGWLFQGARFSGFEQISFG